MLPAPLTKGDIVQIMPAFDEQGLVGALVVVEDVHSMGVDCLLRVPVNHHREGTWSLRLAWKDFELVGRAVVVEAEEV